jgi:hypothetical protein
MLILIVTLSLNLVFRLDNSVIDLSIFSFKSLDEGYLSISRSIIVEFLSGNMKVNLIPFSIFVQSKINHCP